MYNTGNHYDLDPEHSAIIDSQTRARIDQATATSTTFASTAYSVATQAITSTVQTAQGVASAYPEIETILMKALKTEQPMTVRVSLIFALAVLLLISFAFGREMTQFFKAQVSETTSEVASSVLGDEATQRSTSEFSKAVIAQVLEDEATRKRLMAFLEQTLTSDDTAKILQGVVAGVLQSEATRKELYDLIMDPYTQKVLLDLVLWLFQQESTTRDLSKLVVSLLADEWFKEQGHEMLVQLLMGVVQDPRVMQATLKSLKDMVQDQSLQQSTGSALWSAVATPFLPSTWLRGKAREASDQARAVEIPPEGYGVEGKGAVSDATSVKPGARELRQAKKTPEPAATQEGSQQKSQEYKSKGGSPQDAPAASVDRKKETGPATSVAEDGEHSQGQPIDRSSPPASRAQAGKTDRAAGDLAGSTPRVTPGKSDDKSKLGQADAQPSAGAGTAGASSGTAARESVKSAHAPPAGQSSKRKAEEPKASAKGASGAPEVERGERKNDAEGVPDSYPSAASQAPHTEDSAAQARSASPSHSSESLTEDPSADTEHTIPEVQSRDEIEVAVFGDEPAEADESTDEREPEIAGGNSYPPESSNLESPPSVTSSGANSSIARVSEDAGYAASGLQNSSKPTYTSSGSAVPSRNQQYHRAGRLDRYSNGGGDGAAARSTSEGSTAGVDPAAPDLNSVVEPRVSLSGDGKYGSVHETRTYPSYQGVAGRLRPPYGLQEEFQRGIGTIGSMVDSIQDEKIKRGIGRIGSVVGKIYDAAKGTVASVRQQSHAPSAGPKAALEQGTGARWEPDLPTEFLDVHPTEATGAERKDVGRQPVPSIPATGSRRPGGVTVAQGARSIPRATSGRAEPAADYQRQ